MSGILFMDNFIHQANILLQFKIKVDGIRVF